MSETHGYNTDLALYQAGKYKKGKYLQEECFPESLEVGGTYPFLKKGHRNYEKFSQVTILEMRDDEVLFDLRATAAILGTSFVVIDGQSYTKGEFKVNELIKS
ncbi:MAG: hypothetical protein K0S20_452 [Patescibacteria group bacterium]|jgi:hypothetical protein|nr:hypothetical protein [Patescibacteria group bacterium]